MERAQGIESHFGPSTQYVIEELKKANFLQLDETVCIYQKKKIYVWVICNDTASLILLLMGRGAKEVYPFDNDLFDKHIVVDRCIVYPMLFQVIQRCWSHILRDALDVYTIYKGNKHYFDLYCKPIAIFGLAKIIAKKTTKDGGASMDTYNMLAY